MIIKLLKRFFPCMNKKSRYKTTDFDVDNYSVAWAELIDNNKKMDARLELSFELLEKLNRKEQLTPEEMLHFDILQIPKE